MCIITEQVVDLDRATHIKPKQDEGKKCLNNYKFIISGGGGMNWAKKEEERKEEEGRKTYFKNQKQLE